jgi:hypothetical protein
VDEADAVLTRLARIERLRVEEATGTRVPADVLLEELRALLEEAEAWSRAEGGEAGERAVEKLRSALARDMIGV